MDVSARTGAGRFAEVRPDPLGFRLTVKCTLMRSDGELFGVGSYCHSVVAAGATVAEVDLHPPSVESTGDP